MYTLEQLQQKTLKELKEIGWQLNVLPAGDRRCRQNWIDALVGTNLPLLKLLETSPGVEVDRVSEAIEIQRQEPIEEFLDLNQLWQLEQPDCPACGGIYSLGARWSQEYAHGFWIIYCQKCESTCSCSIEQLPACLSGDDDDDDEDELPITEPELLITEPIEVQRQEPFELGLDEKLPSEDEARSIVAQYFISTALRKIRNAPPLARVFSPGQHVRIIEVVVGSRNSQFCGSIGIVAEHNFNVWVWVELDGGGRKIVICRPKELELIELVAEESAAKQEPIESKFGRIVYPKVAAELIAPAAKNLTSGGINETRPNTDRTGSADLYQRCLHSTQPDGNNSGIETETLGSRKGDRVLAVPGDSQADRRRVLPNQSNELTATIFTDEQSPNRGDGLGGVESEVKVSQSAIALDAKISVGVEADRPLEPMKIPPGVALSLRFLSFYSPPQSESICYKADIDGQLSLLDFEVQSEVEPPDPDDFESLDDFRNAIALWDIEHPESLEVSLDSFTYQAHYELAEPSEVMEFSSAILAKGCVNESSSTYNFSIPTFDAWCDRTNRNSSDEPPTAGVGARRPKPKPPSFSPMVVAAGDRTNRNSSDEPLTAGVGARRPKPKPPSFLPMVVAAGDRFSIKRFVRSAIILSARAPPGGDVVNW